MDKESLDRSLLDLPNRPWRLHKQGDYWQIVASNEDVIAIVVCPKDSDANRIAHFIVDIGDLDLASSGEEGADTPVDTLKEALTPYIEQLKINFGNVCPEVFAALDELIGC